MIQFLKAAERGEALIEDIREAHSLKGTRRLLSAAGIHLTDAQTEEIASIRRKDFVDSIRIIEDGGALGMDMWRPIR